MTVERDQIKAMIARHRDNPLLDLLARAAERYLRAYRNELNWSVEHNGESTALAAMLALHEGAILDVGANIGQWARMAQSLAPDRDIHCFEIAPATFRLLGERIRRTDNIHLVPLGLSSREEILTLYHYPDSPDRSSVVAQDDTFAKQAIEARVTTGDKYVSEHGLDRICYLKIDVEGHEMEVLRGFGETLRERRIAAVQFEHGPAHIASRHFLRDFVAFFAAFGYRVHEIYPGALPPLAYSPETSESFTGRNYLACLS